MTKSRTERWVTQGGLLHRRGRTSRELTPEAPTGDVLDRPNVLWIVTDDQEVGTMGADVFPYFATNPYGNWLTFPNAAQSTPLCAISRATMFSAQNWQRHGVESNTQAENLDEDDTLATVLAAADYRTGLLGKYENNWPYNGAPPAVPPGWEVFHGRITETVGYYSWTAHTNIPGAPTAGGTSDADYSTDVLRDLADDFIRGADERPWFLMVTPGAPHEPFAWPTRHASLTWTLTDPPDFNPTSMPGFPTHMTSNPALTGTQANQARSDRRQGRRVLRSVDEMIETLMTALSDTGQLDNTVVIFCTDNAAMMGRKRRSARGGGGEKRMPYQTCIDPLLKVRYPGATQGEVTSPISTVDIPASIAGWAGGAFTHTIDGSDRLADWCLGQGDERPSAYSTHPADAGVPEWHAIVRPDGSKLVRYPSTGEWERFDLTTDPNEMTNLYGVNPTIDADLAAELAQHRADRLFWEA